MSNNNDFHMDTNPMDNSMDMDTTGYLEDDSEVMKYVDLNKDDLTAEFAGLNDMDLPEQTTNSFNNQSGNGLGSFFSTSMFFPFESKNDQHNGLHSEAKQHISESFSSGGIAQNTQYAESSASRVKIENNDEKSALERWKDRLAAAVPTFYTKSHADMIDSNLALSAGVPAASLDDGTGSMAAAIRDTPSISEAVRTPSSDSGLNNTTGGSTGAGGDGGSTANTSPSAGLNTLSMNNNKSGMSNTSSSYRASQVRLSSMKFGRLDAVDAFDNPSVTEDTGIDDWDRFMEIHNATNYKHKMYICDFPKRSRVETQIKCRLIFSPAPEQHLVHLPPDTMARPRFQLQDAYEPSTDTIDLCVDVVSPTNPQKTLLMCPKCLNREKRRAFRKKNLDPNEENHWCETRNRRLAIFNCKEVISLPLAKPCEISEGVQIQGRELELPLRLVCYCRHHPAKKGFRVIFTARNHLGEVVGRAVTDNVLITDDHKESRNVGRTSSVTSLNYSQGNSSTAPPSPLSMEESSDFSSSTSYKRRRESDWNGGSMLSSTSAGRVTRRYDVGSPSSSDGGGLSINSSIVPPGSSTRASNDSGLPVIMRVIPSQGSIRGGIEVTLLGSGFQSGLSALFGGVKSSSTHCWNDSTIVTQLPPASQAGPVIVTFDGIPSSNPPMFRYIDDTDRQLIELALQVVGLKMNGKLEDARNIAMRIVGTNGNSPSAVSNSSNATSPADSANGGHGGHAGVSFSDDHEEVILRCINLGDLKQGMVPNWQLRNTEGQTMMHLAAILGYYRVVSALIGRGARIDIPDLNGMCPIHFASMFGHRRVVNKLLKNHADPYHETLNGSNAIDLCAPEISDLLPSDDFHIMTREHARGVRSRRSGSTSTVISSSSGSSNNSIVSMSMLMPSSSKVPQSYLVSPSDSFTDSGELDGDSGIDDDKSLHEVSGIITPEMEDVSMSLPNGAPRAFTQYVGEGQKTVPPLRATNPTGPAENISSYIQQLTANARSKMQWDRRQWDRNWDEVVNYISRHTSRLDRSMTETETEGTVVGSSSHTDATRVNSNSDSDVTTVNAPRVSMARVWQYITQQELIARRALAHPPSYDEIFGTMAPAHNFEGEKSAEMNDNENETETKEEDAEEKFVRTWVTQRKQLKNDKMLFFFWIPVMLLTFLYVLGFTVIPQTYQPQDFLKDAKEWLSSAFLGNVGGGLRADQLGTTGNNNIGERAICSPVRMA